MNHLLHLPIFFSKNKHYVPNSKSINYLTHNLVKHLPNLQSDVYNAFISVSAFVNRILQDIIFLCLKTHFFVFLFSKVVNDNDCNWCDNYYSNR